MADVLTLLAAVVTTLLLSVIGHALIGKVSR
jgi:membrane protein YqaA with SNARE-associated domain